MEEYINKAAVKTEIDRIQNTTMDKNKNFTSFYDEGKFDALTLLENYIDSLDVKEVDFDIEVALWANAIPEMRLDDVERLAKYFYELGLNAKGE